MRTPGEAALAGVATPLGAGPDDQRRELASLHERLRQTELRLHGMEQIGQILASGPDLGSVVEEIDKRSALLMDCERASLCLLDGGRLVRTVVHDGVTPELELRLGQGIAGWVVEHGRAVNVKDAYRDPRFDATFDERTGFRTRSILSQPLRDHHDRPLGVLQALNKRQGYFSTDDEALLEAIANQAAVVIRSARLFTDLARKHHTLMDTQVELAEQTSELNLLFAIEHAAAVARDLDEALDGALAATLGEYPCEAAAVLLCAEGEAQDPLTPRHWRVRRAAGDRGHELAGATGLAMEPLLSEALIEGRGLLLFDSPRLPAIPKLLAGFGRIETLVSMPLLRTGHGASEMTAGERPIGALMLINSRRFPRCFDELDRHKLAVIASRMALSVALAGALEDERKAERMAAIGGALSGIVHDLRTPLTLLDGYARMLAREDDAAARLAVREKHKQQIDRVNGMIHDVLAFARGESQVLPRKVWMRDFLSEIEEMLRIELEGSGVVLSVEAVYRGGVRMDDAKMKRVLTNLARNAREAMGLRGGELRITALESEGRAVLRVSDTGPGIPAEMEGRLFESFATFGKEHGTGLGLAVVKAIVDQHDGTLEVLSVPGEGTTFNIGLPIA